MCACGLEGQTCNGTQEDEQHQHTQGADEQYTLNTQQLRLDKDIVNHKVTVHILNPGQALRCVCNSQLCCRTNSSLHKCTCKSSSSISCS